MKVMVTGGAGFIGSWLVESLVSQDFTVYVVDSFSKQIHDDVTPETIAGLQRRHGCEFIHADIRDMSTVENVLAKVEVVVHLAAETGTGQSMYQIGHYCEVNHQATAAMLEAIATRHRQIRNVVLASSRAVYGEGAYRSGDKLVVPGPRDSKRMKRGLFEVVGSAGEPLEVVATPEDVSLCPASIYAATKVGNEHVGRICADAFGLQVTALRFQNVYGERQSFRNPYTGILSAFANRMRQDLEINIFEDGLESRDFVHVADAVSAIELAINRRSPGYRVYNVGSGVRTSIMDVAAELKRLTGSKAELKITGDFRVGDIRHCYADLGAARKELGYRPRVALKDGLERLVGWVMTQPVSEDQSSKASAELSKFGLGFSHS